MLFKKSDKSKKALKLQNKAYKLAQKHKFKEALKVYNKSLELEDDAVTYYDIGTVYADLNMIDEEIESYEKAIKLGLYKWFLYFDYSVALTVKEDFEKAKIMLLKVLQQKPDFAEAHNNLGNIYAIQNNYDKAIESFQKAVDLIEDFDYAYLNLALALKEQKRTKEAISAIKNAIKYNSYEAEYYYELGLLFIHENKTGEAKEIVEKLMELDKEYAKKLLKHL